jgi:putative tributyrin esterase
MAFIQAHFDSPVLKKKVALWALTPDQGHGRGPFPVLYLLHGLSDDHTMWMRRTSLERYVEGLPLVVVMPDGFRSFYTDNHAGPAYGRYMIEDVLGFAERTLPIKATRANRCISGLSMGGYGAIRLALAHPELFVSASSHSGALMNFRSKTAKEDLRRFPAVFGPKPKNSAHDVFFLSEACKAKRGPKPKLRLDTGSEDHLAERSRAFSAHLTAIGYAHEYEEFPGGHNWEYWDTHVRDALRFHQKALKLSDK